jgi:hypothetical protein
MSPAEAISHQTKGLRSNHRILVSLAWDVPEPNQSPSWPSSKAPWRSNTYEVKTCGGHTIAVPNAVPADAHGW